MVTHLVSKAPVASHAHATSHSSNSSRGSSSSTGSSIIHQPSTKRKATESIVRGSDFESRPVVLALGESLTYTRETCSSSGSSTTTGTRQNQDDSVESSVHSSSSASCLFQSLKTLVAELLMSPSLDYNNDDAQTEVVVGSKAWDLYPDAVSAGKCRRCCHLYRVQKNEAGHEMAIMHDPATPHDSLGRTFSYRNDTNNNSTAATLVGRITFEYQERTSSESTGSSPHPADWELTNCTIQSIIPSNDRIATNKDPWCDNYANPAVATFVPFHPEYGTWKAGHPMVDAALWAAKDGYDMVVQHDRIRSSNSTTNESFKTVLGGGYCFTSDATTTGKCQVCPIRPSINYEETKKTGGKIIREEEIDVMQVTVSLTMASSFRGSTNSSEEKMPLPHHHEWLMHHFLRLNPLASSLLHSNNDRLRVIPLGHSLLLHPRFSDLIYVNGQLLCCLSAQSSLGPGIACEALFGYDLKLSKKTSTSSSSLQKQQQGQETDWDLIRSECGKLLQNVLLDFRLADKQVASKMFFRLVSGVEPSPVHPEEKTSASASTSTSISTSPSAGTSTSYSNGKRHPFHRPERENDVTRPCWESIIISSTRHDPVGLAAKALGTYFSTAFGKHAYPCLAPNADYIRDRLGGHVQAILVPQRVLDVLGRAGYFDLRKQEVRLLWKFGTEGDVKNPNDPHVRSIPSSFQAPIMTHNVIGSEDAELEATLETALNFLRMAGCHKIGRQHVVFIRQGSLGDPNPIQSKLMCRQCEGKFYVNDAVFLMWNKLEPRELRVRRRAAMLGFYMAQEHPDGGLLVRYLIQNGKHME